MSQNIKEHRKPEYEINDFFFTRWSPRAMTGEAMEIGVLEKLFEAAKWAPSCFNDQPWFFLYAERDTEDWPLFLDLLVEANRAWAKNASALLVVVSKKNFTRNGNPNRTHSYDAGAAWQNFALQAHLLGWAAHGMAGFDYEKTREVLNIPENIQVEAMIAVGKPAEASSLPDSLREKEWPPSQRQHVSEFVRRGRWNF